ncbi:Sir2 family NAD-dependent protein deacetylase [Humidisolicoccus flavus]|uniref:Sir2 family NAD-dependent protein deacetylase n=1 Tax=Humidisolicoccus flavus TaxID=3111414 RepID=UPI0032558B41
MRDTDLSILRNRKIAVLSGAGISTDSGIPDYRGAGAPPRNPMLFDQFVSSEAARRRYWAGSHLGWKRFTSVRPNDGHRAVAALERAGFVRGVVTQNVDDLHEQAGSKRVVHVHGSMASVSCLQCKTKFPRTIIATKIAALNPWIEVPEEVHLQPDGDVDIAEHGDFAIPECPVCGGMLKPDVVFFGEFVPEDVFAAGRVLMEEAEVVLVAGSSLVVNSGTRLLEVARRRAIPIVIINRGVTKWDARAALKIDAGTSETLQAIASGLGVDGAVR